MPGPIGRYLYDLAAPWVEIAAAGKSYAIKDSELPKLRKLLGAPKPTTRKAAPKPSSAPTGTVKEAIVMAIKGAQDMDHLKQVWTDNWPIIQQELDEEGQQELWDLKEARKGELSAPPKRELHPMEAG